MISLKIQAIQPIGKIPDCRARKRPHFHGALQGIAWLLASMLISNPAVALDVKQNPRASGVEEMPKAVESPIHYGGIVYKSDNRRDPFLNPIPFKKQSSRMADEEADRGLSPPGIAGTYIAQATLQGVSMQDNGRVAIVRGVDTRAYFLREGDRLFDGYIKTIDSDSITLVRETKMKSGKILTQDVTKRLRTP